jgi:hypothetical protein
VGIKLDRNRKHGTVYGDDAEKYYQDGNFFDGQGNFVRSASGNRVEPKDDGEAPGVAQLKDEGKAARIKELGTQSIPALRKLVEQVEAATGKKAPEGGSGAKARYVQYIADNTTD